MTTKTTKRLKAILAALVIIGLLISIILPLAVSFQNY